MADKLTPKCDKKAILLCLDWLMEHGNTLKGSCEKIEKEHGQKWSTTKQQYVRAQAANSDNGGQIQKNHGLFVNSAIIRRTFSYLLLSPSAS